MKTILISMLFLPVIAHAELLGYRPIEHAENVARIEIYDTKVPESSWGIPGCSHAMAARMHTTVKGIDDNYGCWMASSNNDTVFVTLPGQEGQFPVTNAYPTKTFIKPR